MNHLPRYKQLAANERRRAQLERTLAGDSRRRLLATQIRFIQFELTATTVALRGRQFRVTDDDDVLRHVNPKPCGGDTYWLIK